ncbi:hypothetical protein [Sphingomonas sp. Leaf198]|uniref:hypothetical protein n=1 Tax=Sphingomonas sp. Leaf198 TaxID=1736299 RepID=UPI0006FF0B9E|nr:hypothetical protein [Sphingomonas sp. Leaf198]KQS49516.1 hypothetical protein ASG20_11000 [Sphingomonas sp. Leaf198]
MKTHRKSHSTENRNARKAIAFRGGARRTGATIPQEQQIVSGRRLRRAARSGKAPIDTFMIQDDGTLRHLLADVDIAPHTRAFLGWRHGTPPFASLGFAIGDDA